MESFLRTFNHNKHTTTSASPPPTTLQIPSNRDHKALKRGTLGVSRRGLHHYGSLVEATLALVLTQTVRSSEILLSVQPRAPADMTLASADQLRPPTPVGAAQGSSLSHNHNIGLDIDIDSDIAIDLDLDLDTDIAIDLDTAISRDMKVLGGPGFDMNANTSAQPMIMTMVALHLTAL